MTMKLNPKFQSFHLSFQAQKFLVSIYINIKNIIMALFPHHLFQHYHIKRDEVQPV